MNVDVASWSVMRFCKSLGNLRRRFIPF